METAEQILREWERAGGIYALAAILVRAEMKVDGSLSGDMEKGQRPAKNDAPLANPQPNGGFNGKCSS